MPHRFFALLSRTPDCRLQCCLVALVGLGILLLASACAGTPGVYYTKVNGTLVPIAMPSSAVVPGGGDALSAYYYSGLTQQAAVVELTQAAGYATRMAQETESTVRLTQVEFSRQLTSDAATRDAQATSASGTATQAWAETQAAWTAAAATSTQARAYTQDAATAQVATETHLTAVAAAAVTASARDTQAAQAATATAARAALDAQTQEVKLWGPIIFWIVVAISLVVFAWRGMSLLEARKRVIPQPNGAPLIIAEQRLSLEKYLPHFLRWIAWFLETRQVLIDPERNLNPVTIIAGGQAEAPQLTDPDRQERVTRRRQFTQVVHALAGEGGETKAGALALAGGPDATALPEPNAGPELYSIIEPGQLNGWLNEVQAQLPEGDDDPALTAQ